MSMGFNKLAYGLVSLGLVAAALGCTAAAPQAAKYPTKPVDVIEAAGAGGGGDLAGRFTASIAAKKFGVPVNVVNVAGASGVTGMLQALKATPDGYTLQVESAARSSYMYAIQTGLPVALEDRTFVAQVTADYQTILVNSDTGWKSVDDLLKFVKTKPTEFKWGAGLLGSNPMFAALALFSGTGIEPATIKQTKMVVTDKGNSASLQAMATGDVQMAISQQSTLASMLATGRVRALATFAPKRFKAFPDIPTMAELGYKIEGGSTWYGLSGPKGLPDSVVKAWNDMLAEAANDPAVQAEAEKASMTLGYLPSAEFKASVLKQHEMAVPVAEALGMRR